MPMDGVPTSSASIPSAQNAPKKTTEGKGGDSAQSVSEPKKDAQSLHPYKGTKHKLAVDGKSVELDYDELVTRAQKYEAADKRFQEAARYKKDFDAVIQGLATGDKQSWQWLKKNVPPQVYKEIVLSDAYQYMEYDTLPADEKKRMELDEREERLKAQEQAREEQAAQQKWASEVQSAGSSIQELLDTFSERTGKKPTSAELMRITEYMLAHAQKYNELPDVDKVYERATRALDIDALDVLGKKTQNVEDLFKWLPKDLKNSLRKAFLEEATSGHPKRYEKGEPAEEAPRRGKKDSEGIGIEDAFARLEKRIKRK